MSYSRTAGSKKLRRYEGSALKDVEEGILSAVEKFADGASPSDDVMLLVVRYHDTHLKPTLK